MSCFVRGAGFNTCKSAYQRYNAGKFRAENKEAPGGVFRMPSCVCGGMNENCCYCHGSGEAGARRTFGRVVPRISNSASRSPVQCPICRVGVTKLQKHLRKTHIGAFNPLPKQKPIKNTPSESSELRSAPSKPQQAQTGTAPQVKLKVALPSSEVTICPVCDCAVKLENLASHVHPKWLLKTTRKSIRLEGSTESTARVTANKKRRPKRRKKNEVPSANIPTSLNPAVIKSRTLRNVGSWPMQGGGLRVQP